MTQYNSGNVKLSNYQLNELKSAIQNATAVTLKLSLNIIDRSHDETNFSHKLSLSDRQISKPRKAFSNNLSVNTKLLKTQQSKIAQ